MLCSSHPPASVVVSTLGPSPSLIRCLESLQRQKCEATEILVVVNHANDILPLPSLEPFSIRLLCEKRPGLGVARNRGIRHARGDIVIFIDDDARADPDWLHELISPFSDPRVACVTGSVTPYWANYEASEAEKSYYLNDRARSPWVLDPSEAQWFSKAFERGVGYGCNLALRKKFLLNYKIFPEEMGAGSAIGGAEEFYMFIQVLKYGFRIAHNPKARVTHFFEKDLQSYKLHLRALHSASVAFTLKLMLEEPGLRWSLLKQVARAVRKRLNHKDGQGPEHPLLSPLERFAAYMQGVPTFIRSRRHRSKEQAL